jgi:DNA-binding GntR family transcriptional regulator
VFGELEPGQVYPVNYFADRLGISRTPVREALLELASHGLVEPLRNRGFRIVRLTQEDVDDIFYVRELLEVPGHGLAAGKLGARAIAHLDSLLGRLADATERQDVAAFVHLDREFHLSIIQQSGSRWLPTLVSRLRDQVFLRPPEEIAHLLRPANQQHEQILQALKQSNAAQVRTIVRHHLRETHQNWVR